MAKYKWYTDNNKVNALVNLIQEQSVWSTSDNIVRSVRVNGLIILEQTNPRYVSGTAVYTLHLNLADRVQFCNDTTEFGCYTTASSGIYTVRVQYPYGPISVTRVTN